MSESGLSHAANAPRQPFVVMAKPVGASCNMKCGYCYYTDGGALSDSRSTRIMPDALLERFIRQYIEANPGPIVSFTWHGGEPTLAGLDFYRKAVGYQRKYLPAGWTCWNSLQTNGLMLNAEWCAFLSDAGFDVGLSIDGTQGIHDFHRKDIGGGATYRRVLAAAEGLAAHGINPDLLCTVTSDSAKEPIAVYRALRNLGSGWIQFIPIVRRLPDGSMATESVSAQAYGLFLRDIFDEWLLHDLGKADVQLFAETMLIWMGKSTNLCTMAPTCGRVLIVEQDGSVYSCDHFVTREHQIGSIETSHLGALIESERQNSFGARKHDDLPRKCITCPWLDVCNGGCPKDRIVPVADDNPTNFLCEGMAFFYAYAEKPLKQIITLRKRSMADEAIQQEFLKLARRIWKDIGRNDPCPCGGGKKAKNCCWERYLDILS